jgi:steroid 5-alpha reductase family enzyme
MSLFSLFIGVWITLILVMCAVWGWYRYSKNPSVVDVAWAIGLTIAGLIYLFSSSLSARHWVISILLILWGVRLAGYLWFTRIRLKHIDPRYQTLSEQWKIAKSLGFFINYQIQALLIMLISLPFLLIHTQTMSVFSSLDYFAVSLVIIGLIGETIADWQLQRFRQAQQKTGEKNVCECGLWYYSRHPNYFFEWASVAWFYPICFTFLVNFTRHTFPTHAILHHDANYRANDRS